MAINSAKKMIRRLDKVVDLIVIVFLLSFMLYGGFAMWDTNQMYSRASSAAYLAYRPTQEEEIGFDQLRGINPNVFGWITVFGTHIDYPLLQGDDNFRYVHTNARGEPAMSGAIFLDFRNDQNLTDFNHIIYGHDMTRNAMFGELARFEDTYFFETRRFGTIFTGQAHYGIEFFAFLPADAYDFELYNPTVSDPVLKQIILDRFFDEAIQYWDAVDVTVDDRLVVLSTCTQAATNGRLLLVGRLMNEIPEDVFEGVASVRGIDRVLGLSGWGLGVGLFFVVAVTISLTIVVAKKKQRKKLEKAGLAPVEVVKMKKKQTTLKSDVIFLLGKVLMIGMMLTLLFTFIFGVMEVVDSSMVPAMQEGDFVLFQRFGPPLLANDTVVVDFNGQPQVSRVVAVAGDEVDITEQGLMINGRLQQEFHIFEHTEQFSEGIQFPVVVGEGEVFVLGDSRARSRDSRIYGPVSTDDVLGSVVTVIRGRNL